MLRLTPAQRTVLAEKFPDLANLFAGGFVIGQTLGDEPISVWLLLLGLLSWVGFMGLALLVARHQ